MAEGIDPLELMPVSPWARPLRWLFRAWAMIVLAFLYLPIAFMILFSFGESPTPGLPFRGPTLRWYGEMISNGVLLDAVWTSIQVAAAATTLATLVGTMAAFPLVRSGIRFAGATRILFTLPIMLPGALIGIALLIFFRRALGVDLSFWTVVMGHIVFTMPFVVLIVSARLQGFDRNLELAAADLGASPTRVLRHIVLPLIAPAIIAGALISVTLSIDEFVITYFTVGPQNTLPTYIYTQIKFGVTPEVNAVATLLLLGTVLLLGLAWAAAGQARRLTRIFSRRRTRGGSE